MTLFSILYISELKLEKDYPKVKHKSGTIFSKLLQLLLHGGGNNRVLISVFKKCKRDAFVKCIWKKITALTHYTTFPTVTFSKSLICKYVWSFNNRMMVCWFSNLFQWEIHFSPLKISGKLSVVRIHFVTPAYFN